MKNKKILIIGVIALLIIIGVIVFAVFKLNKKDDTIVSAETEEQTENLEEKEEKIVGDGKIDIVDINSKSRPYAVVVNNTPVAVKVQEGLNKAYLVYEFPTEGNTSRLMALYKDVPELTIGTIRSSRHNFIDYALESDCIYVHFGWSKWAEADQKAGSIQYLNGLFGNYLELPPEEKRVSHSFFKYYWR